jgi:L-iditol 2-dehydrogenase
MALEMVKPNGAVVQLGEADSWKIEETKAIRRKDFYCIRSFYFPINEYEDNIQILRRNKSKFETLVDAQVSLDQLSELFVEFAAGSRIKPQLNFQE